MKRLTLVVLLGGFLTLWSGSAQAQVTYTLEEHVLDIGKSITAAPIVAASPPSLHTATLGQITTGSTAAIPGFTYADNNGGGVVAYGNNLNNVIVSNLGDGTALETLTVTFDQAITDLTFQFVTVPVALNAPIELSVTADTGLTASSVGMPNLLTGNNEGSLSLSGAAFTSISIQLNGVPLFAGDTGASVGDDFAVDTFVTSPGAAVPEPGVLALLLGSGLSLACCHRRQKARDVA